MHCAVSQQNMLIQVAGVIVYMIIVEIMYFLKLCMQITWSLSCRGIWRYRCICTYLCVRRHWKCRCRLVGLWQALINGFLGIECIFSKTCCFVRVLISNTCTLWLQLCFGDGGIMLINKLKGIWAKSGISNSHTWTRSSDLTHEFSFKAALWSAGMLSSDPYLDTG